MMAAAAAEAKAALKKPVIDIVMFSWRLRLQSDGAGKLVWKNLKCQGKIATKRNFFLPMVNAAATVFTVNAATFAECRGAARIDGQEGRVRRRCSFSRSRRTKLRTAAAIARSRRGSTHGFAKRREADALRANQLPYSRIEQGGELTQPVIIARPGVALAPLAGDRVAIDFADAGSEPRQRVADRRRGDVPAFGEAEDLVIGEDACRRQAAAQPLALPGTAALGEIAPPPRRRLAHDRHPHGGDAVLGGKAQKVALDHRMDVKVMVPVDVVEREAGGAEGIELRPHLGGELTARRRRKEEAEPLGKRIGAKAPVAADEGRNALRRQHWSAVDESEMQPDPEPLQVAGARDGVGGARLGDHQAGTGQDAVAMAAFHRLVDGKVAPEII